MGSQGPTSGQSKTVMLRGEEDEEEEEEDGDENIMFDACQSPWQRVNGIEGSLM